MILPIAIGIIAVLFIAYALYGFAEVIVTRSVKYFVRTENYSSVDSEKKREDTLIQFITRIVRTVIVVVSLFALLAQFGLDLAPFLAAAGVVGIAIGFGTQYLFRDLFTGVVLVYENQYRVGDSICINNVCGDVEQVTLRFTRLRDLDGVVYFIPHGEIKIVSNRSRGFSRVNLNITISHDADFKRASEVIDRVGGELLMDSVWKERVATAPHVLRLEDFTDAGTVLKIACDTAPGKNQEVASELRKRIKEAFLKEGIVSQFSKVAAPASVKRRSVTT